MSLYKDASLVMIPSAYKDGKLYSIRPTDGSGDFTFSRGSNLAATRVDVNGLIEKGRENTTTYSQDSSQWFDVKLGIVSSSNTDPFNGSSAVEYEVTSTTGAAYFYPISPSISSGQVVTGSVYIKNVDQRYIQLLFGSTAFGNGHYQNFDLQTGTKGTSANIIDSSIESVGNGWYRLSITKQATANGSSGLVCGFVPSSSATRLQAPSTLGLSLQAFGFQTELGLVATDYIETGASTAQAGILEDMPRLDYSGSCPALLLEPQRTNLIGNSEYLNAFPVKSQISVASNAAISPDGLANASKLIPDTSNVATHYIRQDVSVSSGSQYVMSFFAKKGEYNYVNTYTSAYSTGSSATWDLNAGVVVLGGSNADIEDYGNGWYRCIWKGTTNSTSLSYRIYVNEFEDRNTSFAGDGVKGAYVYGATLEAGSYPTSYIPTYGSSVTRSVDSFTRTGISSLINSQAGVFFVEMAALSSNTGTSLLSLSDGSPTNNVYIGFASTTNQLSAVLYANGSAQGAINTFSYDVKQMNKIAVSYKTNEFKLFVNGSLVGTDTTATMPNANTLNEFSSDFGQGSFKLAAELKQAIIFPTALTDSECIALTTL